MSEQQQQFQFGDRVKVTMELTVGDPESARVDRGTVYPWTVEHWANECEHITVELIERPAPPREPGWYLCQYADAPRAVRWDGMMWRWPGSDKWVINQDEVIVLGAVTLNEGVEL